MSNPFSPRSPHQPMMDRNCAEQLPKMQCGFIDFVCSFVYKVMNCSGVIMECEYPSASQVEAHASVLSPTQSDCRSGGSQNGVFHSSNTDFSAHSQLVSFSHLSLDKK